MLQNCRLFKLYIILFLYFRLKKSKMTENFLLLFENKQINVLNVEFVESLNDLY
jgi:hypothetical protein